MTPDVWDDAERLERYVGRWSRLVAREFVDWLDVPAGEPLARRRLRLRRAHRDRARAGRARRGRRGRHVGGVRRVRRRARDRSPRLFAAGDAQALDHPDAVIRCRREQPRRSTSSPTPGAALAEMARVVRPGGVVAGYVWDYAGEMQLMRRFWDAAVALDPAAADLDEGRRMAGAVNPPALEALFSGAGLARVETRGDRRADRLCRLRRLLGAVRGRPGPGARLLRLTARGSPRGAPRSGFARRSPSRRTARYG